MDLQRDLWWCSIIAEAGAFAVLALRRLASSYAWFSAYLAFNALLGVGLQVAAAPNTRSYAIAWMATIPILLATLVAATLEIVRKIPRHYRGFGSFGRRRLRLLLQAAVAISLISSAIEAGGPKWTLLAFVIALHRITTTMLAIYLVLVAVFISRAPARFPHNLVIHSRLLAAYLLLESADMLWDNLIGGGHGSDISNMVLTGGSTALFVLWAVLMTPQGELIP
ncbi:MAG TPA: hypothetical protein VFB28_11580, partial [Terriglobales bacterium]|nr:hypothetical protein [Terriglobales bacterium]